MYHAVIALESHEREEMIDVTREVARVVVASGVGDGIVTVFVPHTSAAITLNENADPDVLRDWLLWMRDMVPRSPTFRHAEGNSDAHIKASLVGNAIQVPLVEGRLRLGRWQAIYFCEFDGPRQRQVEVSVS